MINYKFSDKGLAMLKTFEGVKYRSYQDSIGKWTIYIGLTTIGGHDVTQNMKITEEQGKREFMKQIVTYENCVNQNVTSQITQNQFDSLVSFSFNLGCAAFKGSTLLKKVNINPNDPTIGTEFEKWCRAGNQVVEGLSTRRKLEYKNYTS